MGPLGEPSLPDLWNLHYPRLKNRLRARLRARARRPTGDQDQDHDQEQDGEGGRRAKSGY